MQDMPAVSIAIDTTEQLEDSAIYAGRTDGIRSDTFVSAVEVQSAIDVR